ncbi:hypothetical protein HWV62_15919 [Athelia sp. TMB]|nr:hypothetical protein HWV62_15919 [Athelia sp. TMB]
MGKLPLCVPRITKRKAQLVPELWNSNSTKTKATAYNLSLSSDSNGQKRVKVTSSHPTITAVIPPPPAWDPLCPAVEVAPTDFWNEVGVVPYNPDTAETMGVKIVQAKRYQNSDAPLRTWLGFRNASLDERMRYEGRGARMHNNEWNGDYFALVTLQSLGLTIQLGEQHPPGDFCVFGQDVHKDFVVLHNNGIHTVSVRSCGCSEPNTPPLDVWRQLLRAGLYPATPLEPQTCATFEGMRIFHMLNLQGKMSAYHFYQSLVFCTDNTGVKKLHDRYRAFTLITRKWRHETMVKRGARAYDPRENRVEATAQGELAVVCRACPVPGWNLPEDWHNASPETAFIYWLTLANDACFRFKNRLRSSDAKDPTLGPGWSYFVDHGPYLEHCKKYASEEEMSTCAGFAAIHLANLKGIKGHRTSGIGGVCCARQQCWRPNGVGDLQKGERYCNMDYIFWSSLIASGDVTLDTPPPSYDPFAASTVTSTLTAAFIVTYLLTIMASYDIVCQWLKGLFERTTRLPLHLQLPILPSQVRGKIPKFHFDTHGKKDHAQYSFNFTRGAGQNEGEGIERNWSYVKAGASQTVEMGPGGRHDVLDDFFGYSNYRKMTDIGPSLLKKAVKAIAEAISHRRAFEELDEHLKEDMAAQVAQWEVDYAAWDRKPTGSPCIFDTSDAGIVLHVISSKSFTYRDAGNSMAKLKLQLANKEAAQSGLTVTPHSQSNFILLALEIEDLQRKLVYDVKDHKNPTALQQAQFQEHRISIRKRVNMFRKLQADYMPGLRRVLRDPTVLDDATDILAERIRLYTPSELSGGSHRDKACITGLTETEELLREATCSDELEQLRRNLLTRTYLNKWRVKNISGQRMSTRARTLQHRIDLKVHQGKSKYRHCRKGLLALRGPGAWETKLRELKDDDVRAMNERALTDHEKAQREHRIKTGKQFDEDACDGVPLEGTSGESRKKLSWIWMTAGGDNNSPEMIEALRVEWAKCNARQARWREELMILQEEMRRVIEYGFNREKWWRERPEQRLNVDDALADGLRAYALEHAEQERAFRVMLEAKWGDIQKRVATVLEDLSKPGFPETEVTAPVTVDGEDGGIPPDICDWMAKADHEADGEEMAEVERIA